MINKRPAEEPDDDPPEPVVYSSTGLKGEEEEEADADVPTGIREATRAEEEEAGDEYPGPEHGRRGDLGDSGPGVD